MKGYWQGEKETESEIGRPIMNSNFEKAKSNREIEYLTAAHGNMQERKRGTGDCDHHFTKPC